MGRSQCIPTKSGEPARRAATDRSDGAPSESARRAARARPSEYRRSPPPIFSQPARLDQPASIPTSRMAPARVTNIPPEGNRGFAKKPMVGRFSFRRVPVSPGYQDASPAACQLWQARRVHPPAPALWRRAISESSSAIEQPVNRFEQVRANACHRRRPRAARIVSGTRCRCTQNLKLGRAFFQVASHFAQCRYTTPSRRRTEATAEGQPVPG